jgi:hypothetical protein
MATLMGLEPTTSAVTGRRSKPTELQRHEAPSVLKNMGTVGFEPTTPRV